MTPSSSQLHGLNKESALHCILFDLQALGNYTDILGIFEPIKRALDMWKLLRDSFNTCTQQQGVSGSGFMAHGNRSSGG